MAVVSASRVGQTGVHTARTHMHARALPPFATPHAPQMRRVDVLGYTFQPGIHTLGTAKPRGGMKRSAASYGMPNRETTTDSGVNLSGLGEFGVWSMEVGGWSLEV